MQKNWFGLPTSIKMKNHIKIQIRKSHWDVMSCAAVAPTGNNRNDMIVVIWPLDSWEWCNFPWDCHLLWRINGKMKRRHIRNAHLIMTVVMWTCHVCMLLWPQSITLHNWIRHESSCCRKSYPNDQTGFTLTQNRYCMTIWISLSSQTSR